MRAGGDDLPYAVEGQVGCAVVQDLGDHLEVLGPGQRADREEAVVAARREDVPVVAVQAGDTDVGDHDRVRVDGLAGHADAEPASDHRTTAVCGHDVPGADGGAGREPDRHTVLVLGEAGDLAVEGHPAAQLVEPGPQDLLGAPLRHHPRGRRTASPRWSRPGRTCSARRPVRRPARPSRPGTRRPPRGSRPGRRGRRRPPSCAAGSPCRASRGEPGAALHDQRVHPAPGEVHAEGESGGAGAHDQYVHVLGHDPISLTLLSAMGPESGLNGVKLSSVSTERRTPWTASASRTRP